MELVRRGCRYTPESIAHLRPSFQESINSGREFWNQQKEDQRFQNFVASMLGQLSDSTWVKDSASLYCLLCMEKFAFTIRRHHCRTCGALCCDLCSSKRIHLTKSSSSVARKWARICDGCFNKLSSDCFLWEQAAKVVQKHQDRIVAESPDLLQFKSSLGQPKRNPASSVGRAHNAATDTRRVVEEWGEILEQSSAFDFNPITGKNN